MPQPPPQPVSITATTIPAWMALTTLCGVAVFGMGIAWNGATQISDMRAEIRSVAAKAAADVATLSITLAEARSAGIREREQVARRSDEADRKHDAELAALQVSSAATATFQAGTGAQMQAILASIAAMQDDLKTLLRQRRADTTGIEGRAAQAVARRDGGTVLRAGRGVPVTVSTGG